MSRKITVRQDIEDRAQSIFGNIDLDELYAVNHTNCHYKNLKNRPGIYYLILILNYSILNKNQVIKSNPGHSSERLSLQKYRQLCAQEYRHQ